MSNKHKPLFRPSRSPRSVNRPFATFIIGVLILAASVYFISQGELPEGKGPAVPMDESPFHFWSITIGSAISGIYFILRSLGLKWPQD